MRVLVTGGTGFIGSHLVQLLVRQNLEVIVLVRNTLRSDHALLHLAHASQKIRFVNADLRNYNLTSRALRDALPTHVIHLAAAGATAPFLPVQVALRHNLHGTINLLRACFDNSLAASHPEQVVVARTPGEKSAHNVYAASKAAAWSFCQMYAVTMRWPVHGANIFQTFGPGQPEPALVPSACAAALAGEPFPMTSGTQLRDWIFVEDVVTGLASFLGAELAAGESLDVGTGRLTSLEDVVRRIFKLAGGKGRPMVGALTDRPGEGEPCIADAARTKELLGWEATVSLEEGLRRTLREMPRSTIIKQPAEGLGTA